MKSSFIVMAFLLISILSRSATITVDDDGFANYSTIQEAIENADPGDEIIVADGIYSGDGNRDISFLGKAITLRSENGPTHCIIDAYDPVRPHRGFLFEYSEGPDSVISGFTIRGGYVNSEDTIGYGVGGAGITCILSAPYIINCIFYDNVSELDGGAIAFFSMCDEQRMLQVKNSTFYGNAARNGGASAIIGSFSSEIVYTNSIFQNNVAVGGVTSDTFYNNVIAKCGPVATSADFSILDEEWWNAESCLVADPLFADPNNKDFHLQSYIGRWDPEIEDWVFDQATSPAIDFGDPADDYSNEFAMANGNRINAGAYGNTPQASLSIPEEGHCDCYRISVPGDYFEAVSVGCPSSWCLPYQCRGDADGESEIIGKGGFQVGFQDIEILLEGFSRPYSGDPLSDPWIAADFDHAAETIGKASFRVGFNDINILLEYFSTTDVPECNLSDSRFNF